MRLSALLLAPLAACQLLVPEISKEDEEMMNILPVTSGLVDVPPQALAQSISIPCTQCKGKDAMIRLDFNVELNKKLVCNDIELYPSVSAFPNSLIALIEKANGRADDRVIGYSLAGTSEGLDDTLKMEVVRLDLGILQVGRRSVEVVPEVRIKLIRAVNGDILIGNIEIVQNEPEPKCDGWFCGVQFLDDWREAAGHKWAHFKGKFGKGCAGHRGSKSDRIGRPKQESGKHEHNGHHGHHNHNEHHGHHSHNEQPGHSQPKQQYSWMSFIQDVTVHIMLPMLMGAAAGAIIAFFGLFISSFVRLVVSFIRGRSTTYSQVPTTLAEEEATTEKAHLMEDHFSDSEEIEKL